MMILIMTEEKMRGNVRDEMLNRKHPRRRRK